ncbi:hypothetical protein BJX99DRAFT_178263 [Aspergillus californicus]
MTARRMLIAMIVLGDVQDARILSRKQLDEHMLSKSNLSFFGSCITIKISVDIETTAVSATREPRIGAPISPRVTSEFRLRPWSQQGKTSCYRMLKWNNHGSGASRGWSSTRETMNEFRELLHGSNRFNASKIESLCLRVRQRDILTLTISNSMQGCRIPEYGVYL